MLKLLAPLVDVIEKFAKHYSPAIFSLIKRVHDRRLLAMSWLARLSRSLGNRAVVTVGVLATLYAFVLFITDSLIPDAPKQSHDVILKTRLSSPKPSANVVILDIDERSLASLAQEHGRWPWPRSVLADGLQKVSDLGARAVLLNVMLSDPDKSNPDSDAAMDVTAQMLDRVAFPLIRLNPKNDKQSKLKVAQIEGARFKVEDHSGLTFAAILPMFDSMRNRLGVANQRPDNDGIVRRYPFIWDETEFTLPSIIKRTAELGQADISDVPSQVSLNWRNKNGRYTRISFSDFLKGANDDSKFVVFKNAFVIIGLSAPGFGQTKGTSAAAVEDDNEILATALDDALHNTYLRTLPAWSGLLISIMTIWALIWTMTRNAPSAFVNGGFLLLQSAFGGITLLTASHTNYLIDLSDSMSFGIAIFAAIKVVQSLDDSWSRAKPGFRKIVKSSQNGELLLISYPTEKISYLQSVALQRKLEEIFGIAHVIRIDDLFGGESFIKPICARFRCLVALSNTSQYQRILEVIRAFSYADKVSINRHELEHPWNPNDDEFCSEVAPIVMTACARLLREVQ